MSNINLECNANDLFEAGAIFIFLDVPPNTEFGIDYNCWRTGENFKGVKMIPPGLHFVYYNVTDKYGNVGLRNGFFYDFKFKEILAKKWDPQSESIDESYRFSDEEMERFELNKKNMDRFLGAYPFDEYKRWKSLTNNLNEKFLKKLLPVNKIISSGSSLIGNKFVSKSTMNKKSENVLSNKEDIIVNTDLLKKPTSLKEAEKMLPEMKEEENTMIRFTNIVSADCYPKGSMPSEITKGLIDQSYKLELLINKNYSDQPLNILCELQFAFVCFLIGQVYDGFEQWKLLINLLCNAEQAISNHPNLFQKFIQCLYFQLKEIPDDFFTDITTRENFLAVNLHNLFDNIKQVQNENVSSELSQLNEKCLQFKNYLQEKFQLDFDLEPDEYAPVVVSSEEINGL